MSEIFAKRLKQLRLEKELSQEETARLVAARGYPGMSKSAISRYENNKMDATIESIIPLTELFGVSLDYLIGISDSRKKQEDVVILTNDEENMILSYRKLGKDGKQYIRDQLEVALQVPKYQKGEDTKSQVG